MDIVSSTISAYQDVCRNFHFAEPSSRAEAFAQARYYKKMEEPLSDTKERLERDAWDRYMACEDRLKTIFSKGFRPNKHWYLARALIHSWLRGYNEQDITNSEIRFPKGAEVTKIYGKSLEARLSRREPWTITHDNVTSFAKTCLRNRALLRALSKRFNRTLLKNKINVKAAHSSFTRRYLEAKSLTATSLRRMDILEAFKLAKVEMMLKCTCDIIHGSRWSSVEKNNTKRRPINIEPFCNVVTQSQVGTFIRNNVLKNRLGIDLNVTAQRHRVLIQQVSQIATIDLSDASDSISLKLLTFLFPNWFVDACLSRRSPMVYGLDKEYHILEKLSSMGNGFTFEILTLILLALCRTYDTDSSTFGDDIIIEKVDAECVINDLQNVGFVVNKEKTFTAGLCRESCGAYYVYGVGYIESYDFKWPKTIAHCVSLCNKAARLAMKYPSFKTLYNTFVRATHPALRGGIDDSFLTKDHLSLFPADFGEQPDQTLDIPSYFVAKFATQTCVFKEEYSILRILFYLNLRMDKFVPAFRFLPKERSASVINLEPQHWAKYFAYMRAGMRVKDEMDEGRWVVDFYVRTLCGRYLSCKQLLSSYRENLEKFSRKRN